MAAAAASHGTWRFVFGNTEEWAQPECGSPSCIQAVAESAVTWRLIFGNTSGWLPPQVDGPVTLPGAALAELCELCRQPIEQDEDFITNSAGERPAHTRCLNLKSPAVAEQGLVPRRWLSVLLDLVKS
jgi:hypothetical protein